MTPSSSWINLLERLMENILFTRLPVYYKRIQRGNSQVEEMHGRGVGSG